MTEETKPSALKLLIVDDEPGLRDMLRFGLTKRGYEVTVAGDAAQALEFAQKQTFDLAVCDIMMPGQSGVDLLPQLKGAQPQLEVIMATGYATLESAIEAMKRGAFDYITKPYSLGHLCTILEKAHEHSALKAKVGYLEELNRLKSDFMATMSHELRTPMASILGYVSLLLQGVYGEMPQAQEKALKRVEANATSLLQLINNVLDLSKLSANRMGLFPETFVLDEIVNEVKETLEPLASAKKLSLVCSTPSSLWLHADKTKLKQVLINLIGNAIKFTKTGGITLSVESQEGHSDIRIKVQDTGIGIAKEDMPLLFQEFKQLDSSTTREHGGTGLGLAICKRIIELMRGSIHVESTLGKGSCFIIDLTCRVAAPPPSVREGPGESLDAREGSEKIILSIDDDPDVLRVIEDSLKGTGFRCVGAPSGHEGLALARKLRPHLITLDIMMPHMDGWSVLQILKNDPSLRSIPVYVVSIVENRALAFSLGVSGYILKPFSRDELLKKLELVPKRRNQQILVVDDDPQIRDLFRESLGRVGYDVDCVASGEEAVSRMKQLRPDILFLDLVLPGMTGFDVLDAVDQGHGATAMATFVMSEKELGPSERKSLEKRVEMVIQKQSAGLEDVLNTLKDKLEQNRRAG